MPLRPGILLRGSRRYDPGVRAALQHGPTGRRSECRVGQWIGQGRVRALHSLACFDGRRDANCRSVAREWTCLRLQADSSQLLSVPEEQELPGPEPLRQEPSMPPLMQANPSTRRYWPTCSWGSLDEDSSTAESSPAVGQAFRPAHELAERQQDRQPERVEARQLAAIPLPDTASTSERKRWWAGWLSQ